MTVLGAYFALGVRDAREPFEPIPPNAECPGSGELVHEDSLDGNFVGTCSACRKPVLAEELVGTLRVVEKHRIPVGRRTEMARDRAADEAVDAHIEARYEGVGQ